MSMTEEQYAAALGLTVEEYKTQLADAMSGGSFAELPKGRYTFKVDEAKARINGTEGVMKGAKQISANCYVLDGAGEPIKGYGRFFLDITAPVANGAFAPKPGVTMKVFLANDSALSLHAGLEQGELLTATMEGQVPEKLIGATFPANFVMEQADNGKKYARLYPIAKKGVKTDVPPPPVTKDSAETGAPVDDSTVAF